MNMQASTQYLLQNAAPAALATGPRLGLSTNYSFLSTAEVVGALETDNWKVVSARQTPARVPGPQAYRKHEIILADCDLLQGRYGIFSEVPRVILTNSHDGGAAFKLKAGLWVALCENGLETTDGVIQSVAIRHSRRTTEEVVATAQAFRENASLISDHVGKFKATNLSTAAAYEFAGQALRLRFDDYATSNAFVDLRDILAPQRREDAGNSLWKVFNRTQEWLLKGGFEVYRKHRETGQWLERKARAIKAIDESSKLNTGLWQLAETFSLN